MVSTYADDEIVTIEIGKEAKWTISPYLASMHMLYTNGADNVYKNGTIADWVNIYQFFGMFNNFSIFFHFR